MTGDRSFTRYLAAKRSVDDRALDRRVWEILAAELARRDGEVDVLEVGAGSGAMIERLVGGGLVRRGRYVAVDSNAHVLEVARRRLPRWATERGIGVADQGAGIELRPGNDGAAVVVESVAADLFDLLPESPSAAWGAPDGAGYDLVVAHAVLDVLDLDTALPRLLAALAPGGVCYFPITFDGGTFFEPRLELDARIEALYHRTMDRRTVSERPSGSSCTGRRLLAALPAAGAELLAAGASDWVVTPRPRGSTSYPADEAYFLSYLLATIEGALAGHPELDPRRFDDWLRRRRQQVVEGELVFVAHQLDVLGVVGRTAASISPPRSDRTPVKRPT